AFNRVLTGVAHDDWRSAAGDQIMSNGYGDFLQIYEGLAGDPGSNWSVMRLISEQQDPGLQSIHERYIDAWMWGLKKMTEVVGEVENILDSRERFRSEE